MCTFLSGLVVRNGDVLTHPMLDSHLDLLRYFKLRDENQHIQHFVKVELIPVDWNDAQTWRWRVDEDDVPAWWADVAEQAESTLRCRAQRMILTEGTHDFIVDGCWIVAGHAAVECVRGGRIVRVQDDASIYDVAGNAMIQGVRDRARITAITGTASIRDVSGSAMISGVRGRASIRMVTGRARVDNVGGDVIISDVGAEAILDPSAIEHVEASQDSSRK